MAEIKLPYGREAKLLVDFQGYPDGRLVIFEIWRKKSGKEEKVSEVYGVSKGGKGMGFWTPQPPQVGERKEVLPLEKKINQQPAQEKYHFIAKIDDKEAKSENLVLVYPLDIYLEDEAGKPINGAKYTASFSDGSKKKGVFENGHAIFTDVPPGKFELELERLRVYRRILRLFKPYNWKGLRSVWKADKRSKSNDNW